MASLTPIGILRHNMLYYGHRYMEYLDKADWIGMESAAHNLNIAHKAFLSFWDEMGISR
jgi:hypothetical protein